jgi:hypothetical protein
MSAMDDYGAALRKVAGNDEKRVKAPTHSAPGGRRAIVILVNPNKANIATEA